MNPSSIYTSESCKKFLLGLIEKKGKLPIKVDDNFDYIRSGHIDSMGLIKFILEIEAQYAIEITDADIEQPKFRTLSGAVEIIQDKLRAQIK